MRRSTARRLRLLRRQATFALAVAGAIVVAPVAVVVTVVAGLAVAAGALL